MVDFKYQNKKSAGTKFTSYLFTQPPPSQVGSIFKWDIASLNSKLCVFASRSIALAKLEKLACPTIYP